MNCSPIFRRRFCIPRNNAITESLSEASYFKASRRKCNSWLAPIKCCKMVGSSFSSIAWAIGMLNSSTIHVLSSNINSKIVAVTLQASDFSSDFSIWFFSRISGAICKFFRFSLRKNFCCFSNVSLAKSFPRCVSPSMKTVEEQMRPWMKGWK